VIIGVLFLFFVFRSIRKNIFHPSYALLWIVMTVFLVSIPVFEKFYKWIAVSVIGIVDARHIIYIFLIGFLLIYVFYLTQKINQMKDQILRLISFTAIIEKEHLQLESRVKKGKI